MGGAGVRVLVTGSSGFLGQHVAADLRRAGFDVTGFDLRPQPDGSIPTIVADLCDLDAVRRACRSRDAIVHLGGIGDVDVATAQPELATRANVVGTTNVALASTEAGSRVVYASTWEVYGPPQRQPVDESHGCDPGHFYGATKLAGEHMLSAARCSGGLATVVLRLGTAYGPGMRPNTVFSRFAAQARARRPIVVHGDGAQWRQFTHTSDVSRAFRLACEAGVDGAVLNIASDESVTIRQLAALVAGRYDVPIAFAPPRPGDAPPSRISSAAAARVLGWHAEVAFEEGLSALLETGDAEWRASHRPSDGRSDLHAEPARL